MTTDNFQIYQLALAVRVITAGICGVIIGLERLTRSKSAGVRTHCIVAVGAALMMVISKYGFSDTVSGEMGMRGADGARIGRPGCKRNRLFGRRNDFCAQKFNNGTYNRSREYGQRQE